MGYGTLTSLPNLDRGAHLLDPGRKQRYVTALFDTVASSYDRFTKVFSFGMDQRWKRTLVGLVRQRVVPDALVLDLATGTGDLARLVCEAMPRARVVGLDASRGMLRAWRGGPASRGAGDMMALPVADGAADAVVAAYAFRNLPDCRRALADVRRVLRRGGLLVTLDFYRPDNAVWRAAFVSYLRGAGGLMGWWWHRAPEAYSYLGPSVAGWVTASEFADGMRAAGLGVEAVLPRLGGGIALHAARTL
jgi:demethylmenaquinone methyltransferase/2-methoxy-6-polyprenyl-1,4-benzoquinol methylase